MRFRTLLFFLPLFLSLCGCHQQKQEETIETAQISDSLFIDLDQQVINEKSAWLHGIFEKMYKRQGFAGAVLYAEKGRLVYQDAFGYAEIAKKTEITTSSSFQLASVSKMFTATAILILLEKHLVDLDTDIREYLPEFPYEGITIRLLLNHRSGLPRYMSLALDQWTDKNVPLTNNDMLDLFVKYKPNVYFKPNHGFHYCNTNYALLANVVERITQMPFDVFIKQNIFEPLQMNNSFIYNMRGQQKVSDYIEDGVPGYHYRGWRPVRQRNDYLNGVMGDKGVYTSVGDLFKFDQALYQNKLVSDSILQLAFSPGSPKSRKRADNYGFGWRIKGGRENTVFHFGWWKGFRSFYIRDMKQEKTIIVLSNRDKGPGSAKLWQILDTKNSELGKFVSLEQEN